MLKRRLTTNKKPPCRWPVLTRPQVAGFQVAIGVSVDAEDYYLDLLFYHRRLRRLVAIELKLDRFKAEYKGQMELYLRWLDRHERQPGEEAPVGLILCAGKSDKHVELLELGKSGIRVAEYMTELPSRRLLEKKLYQAIKSARSRLESEASDHLS